MSENGEEEHLAAGIYARRTVDGTPYWWVLWAPPWNQVGRDDHWQPAESFYDADTDTSTALWDAFERLYPRD